MKTAHVMFSMMLAMTAGCATTLDQLPVAQIAGGSDGAAMPVQEGACFVTGVVHSIAPKALVRPGLEVVPTATGLALGFSSSPHDAVALTIDARSAAATGSSSRHSSDTIRRVTPLEHGADVDAAIDTDCKTHALRGSVTISAKEPFVIGTVDSDIAWASCASAAPRALWRFTDGAVQDLRGIALADGGFAIVFRQGGSVWFGRIDAEKNADGPLEKIAERAELRSPVLAESADNILVVWSEEAHNNWSLGGVSVAPCGRTTPVHLGGPMAGTDGDAIQPALVGVDNGNFLLVWTEGPAYTHQVRAVTIEAHGRAVGPVLAVSSGAESGWGRPALMADGRGAVFYLVPTDTGFAVAATPIACPLSPTHANRVATRL